MIVPSDPDLVVKGALNPGAIQFGDEIVLLLRIAEGCKPVEGRISVPVYRFENGRGTLKVMHLDEADPDGEVLPVEAAPEGRRALSLP